MMEEFTPQVAASSLLLIIISAPMLTLLLSALLLWRYRRAVMRAMAATGDFHAPVVETRQPAKSPPHGEPKVEEQSGSDVPATNAERPVSDAGQTLLDGHSTRGVAGVQARIGGGTQNPGPQIERCLRADLPSGLLPRPAYRRAA